MNKVTRRDFVKTGLVAGALTGTGALHALVPPAKATDWVTLGKSDVRVTRLAFGTGSYNGSVQRNLGQAGFNNLVRYAYDQGVRFFETSDSYTDMHRMLGIALQGIPRENYRLMSKITTSDDIDPQQHFDNLRRQIQSDYFDIMLLHWQHTADWPETSKRWQDGIVAGQHRGVIRSRGASVHGLPALRQMPGNDWLQVAMIRMNHKGTRMDAEEHDADVQGNVPEVVSHVRQVRAQGMGVVSMKLIGEGVFNQEDRQKAMRFAFRNAGVDSVTVGYKSPAEIDEAIHNLNMALA